MENSEIDKDVIGITQCEVFIKEEMTLENHLPDSNYYDDAYMKDEHSEDMVQSSSEIVEKILHKEQTDSAERKIDKMRKIYQKNKLPVRNILQESLEKRKIEEDEDRQQTTRKQSVTDLLNYNQEEELVQWFYDHPIFYDQSVRQFKNKPLKMSMVGKEASKYGLRGQDLLTWFQSMRTSFGKLYKRLRSGQTRETLTFRQKWIIDSFSFLTQHVIPKGKPKNVLPTTTTIVSTEQTDETVLSESDPVNISQPKTDPMTYQLPEVSAGPSSVSIDRESPVTNQAFKRKKLKQDNREDELLRIMSQRLVSSDKLLETLQKAMEMSVDKDALEDDRKAKFANWLKSEIIQMDDDIFLDYSQEIFKITNQYSKLQRHINRVSQQQH